MVKLISTQLYGVSRARPPELDSCDGAPGGNLIAGLLDGGATRTQRRSGHRPSRRLTAAASVDLRFSPSTILNPRFSPRPSRHLQAGDVFVTLAAHDRHR